MIGVRGEGEGCTSEVYEGATEVTDEVSGSRVYRGSGSRSCGRAAMKLAMVIVSSASTMYNPNGQRAMKRWMVEGESEGLSRKRKADKVVQEE